MRVGIHWDLGKQQAGFVIIHSKRGENYFP
jgi:hypothetical protein